jgi:4-hydroxy-tetrahydrodipicolinate synthase
MARKLEKGFITALGTPRDSSGNLIEESLEKHVNDQINGDVHGFLVLGSMGDQPGIRDSEYLKVIKTVIKKCKENGPNQRILVGVMDNSIERVMDRIEVLKGLEIDGVVVTAPYYFTCSQVELIRFFSAIADKSLFPVYLYDIPYITKNKIALETQKKLAEHRNIWGCKCSEHPDYIRKLVEYFRDGKDYKIIEAQFDLFDLFHRIGAKLHLDGFICLFPQWLKLYWNDLESGNWEACRQWQNKISRLRDAFIEINIWATFSYAMNLIGYKGSFAPLHMRPLSDEEKKSVKELMTDFELIKG